jgi:glyoxylase-like metal-dependent hydrolase (beta-lactamase superfamily II)
VGDEIRLYLFDSGYVHVPLNTVKLHQGLGESFTIPVPWYVITHPRGNVLIDGGNPPVIAVDPRSHWGAFVDFATPEMTPEQACVPALELAGIDPASIRWVVQSHLHGDHTGAVAVIDRFPNAQVLVTRAEHEYAHAPDWFAELAYIRADYVKPGVPWVFLDERDDGYDLFGDGTIRCWQTPGHSPGHMSFEVNLPSGSTVLLACDAVPTQDHWDEKALLAVTTSMLDGARSIRRLRRIAGQTGATVVFGHDLDQWSTLRHPPESYA